MQTQMNPGIFKENLIKAIAEINPMHKIKDALFELCPVKETNKHLNSDDDIMRLLVLNDNFITNKLFNIDKATQALTYLCNFNKPLVPIWINVEYLYSDKEKHIYKLFCSMRYRKPSLLRNQETGHPPFKSIVNK